MTRREPEHPVASAPASDLAQLVAIEQGLEQRLGEARREARALLEETRAACDDALRRAETELAATRLDRARQLKLEQETDEARLLDEGRRRAAWYEHLPSSTQDQLAGYVVDWLLREGQP